MTRPFWVLVGLDPTLAGDRIQKYRKDAAVVYLELSDGPNAAAAVNGSKPPRVKHDSKNSEFTVQLLFKDAMPTALIKQHFTDVNRNPSSVSSTLNELQSAGDIKKDPRTGAWMLTKKARDRVRPKKKG